MKTGIRQAAGAFILIIDADGQHRPADATRLVAQLDAYDLVVGARSGQTQASLARRLGNAVLNRIASYLTEQPIPDLTSGFRAARRECLLEFLHLLPNGFSTPTTTTLAFIRRATACASSRSKRRSGRACRRSGSAPTACSFFLILLKVITIFSPLRIFAAGQRGRISARRRLRGLDDRHAVARHELVGAADPAERGHLSGRPGLGADFLAALRRTAAVMAQANRTALVIVPTYNERENLPVLVGRADAASRTSACWSSTISRRTAPARWPTSWRASIRAASR